MNTKIIAVGVFVLGSCFAGSVKADYWTQQSTISSNGVIPQYFEAETMAKSSNGVVLIYGIERIPGQSCPSGCPAHVISYNSTSGAWKDESNDIKTAGGLTSFEFMRMYADQSGNVWMSNRNPGVLLKYNDSTWSQTTAQSIVDDVFSGETASSVFIDSVFHDDNNSHLYAFAHINTGTHNNVYLIYLNESTNRWIMAEASGGPLNIDEYASGAQLFGYYHNQTNQIWCWKWRSFDSDTSFGLYQLDVATNTWTRHYSGNNSTLANNSGDHVSDVFGDSGQNVWIATRYGAFKYSGGSWTQLTKENSQLSSNRISKIQEDSDHRVWIVGLNEADIGDMVTKGGMSIYDLASNTWKYYSSKNGEDVIDSATNVFIFTDEVWLQSGHGDDATSGIYVLTRDDSHTALYGQVSGTTVDKAEFETLKKNSSSKSSKKVTIWKKYKVKKKWRKTRVYSGKTSSSWYKKLNLAAGANIKYIIKAGKKTRTVSSNTGDPIRVNFK